MTNTERTACQHTDKMVFGGVVTCANVACRQEFDDSGSRPGTVEANQFR